MKQYLFESIDSVFVVLTCPSSFSNIIILIFSSDTEFSNGIIYSSFFSSLLSRKSIYVFSDISNEYMYPISFDSISIESLMRVFRSIFILFSPNVSRIFFFFR